MIVVVAAGFAFCWLLVMSCLCGFVVCEFWVWLLLWIGFLRVCGLGRGFVALCVLVLMCLYVCVLFVFVLVIVLLRLAAGYLISFAFCGDLVVAGLVIWCLCWFGVLLAVLLSWVVVIRISLFSCLLLVVVLIGLGLCALLVFAACLWVAW